MEEIVENLPKLKSLLYTFLIDSSDISIETTQNLINIDHFKTLTEIDISGIPEIFDFYKFVNFMNASF
uniref:Uncharacterized protein n=1 Tax=Panagrolaimus sp. PS1159 TaxID=55785 RepID=A0AC35EW75_9BILA